MKETTAVGRFTPTEFMAWLRSIRLLSLDVDGVFTDGGIYFADDGMTLRRFNVRDGQGVKQVIAAGMEVAIISAGIQDSIRRRMQGLGIRHVHTGVRDKAATCRDICEKLGIGLAEVAHLGDDLPDLELMQAVGCPIAVADAVPEILAAARYVTDKPGGAGAVREICDFVVAAKSESGPA
jgi:3-deoxy-D-manno-octulosonate 8-phosphate phosphatase (KDO 8-P phosphatase)